MRTSVSHTLSSLDEQAGPPPVGLLASSAFFGFGSVVAFVTAAALAMPHGPLESIWRLNPAARASLEPTGRWGLLLMLAVGTACGAAAAGLWGLRRWGHRLAIGILIVNLVGDAANAIIRHDLRTLIGLPIGGALIAYLLSRNVRVLFGHYLGRTESDAP